eukprot:s5795_g3.t1
MVKGRLVVPAQETTTQGSEIDYAVASEVIAAITHVEVDWDVPFRPHAAVRYSVHKGGATMPVPQASEVIAAITHVEVDWDVPFRPHAAVRYSVHKGGATMPVPQAPRFGAEPGDNQDAPSQATIEQVEALFEEPTTQDEAVAKVLSKMAKKAVGPDGLSAQMLRALQPDQVALVAQAW